MADLALSQHRLSVSATGGQVSLSGSVRTEEERRTAQSRVAGLPGVSNVLNEIIVAAPPEGFRRPGV